MKIKCVKTLLLISIICLSMYITAIAGYTAETETKVNSFTIAPIEERRFTIDWVDVNSIELNYLDEFEEENE